MPPKEGEINTEDENELDAELDADLSKDDPGEADPGEADKLKESEEEEITVSIGEEKPAEEENEPAPGWVKELRKSHRQTQKENRELRRKLEDKDTKADEVGKKPSFGDYGLDTDKYETDLSSWHERKRVNELKEEKASSDKKTEEMAWQTTLDSYEEKKTSLRVKAKGFDDAEALVEETLSIAQQGIILNAADDPALLILAIGSNQKKVKELAAIKDPVKFSFAVAKLETQLKVSPRKAATKPEKQLSNSGTTSSTADNTLTKLREKAEKTGDYSAVTKYNRDQRRKAS